MCPDPVKAAPSAIWPPELPRKGELLDGRSGPPGGCSAPPAGGLVQHDPGGHTRVERLGAARHRDADAEVAGLADQAGQALALAADHDGDRAPQGLKVTEF